MRTPARVTAAYTPHLSVGYSRTTGGIRHTYETRPLWLPCAEGRRAAILQPKDPHQHIRDQYYPANADLTPTRSRVGERVRKRGLPDTPVFIVLLLLALALLSACGGGSKPDTSSITPQEILDRAGKAMADLKSFHFKMTHEAGGSTPLLPGVILEDAEGDVARPGRLKAKLGVKSSGFGGEMFVSIDLITIGDTTWMGGIVPDRWASQPTAVSPAGFFDPDAGMSAILKSLTLAGRLPDEGMGKAGAFHLRGQVTTEVLEPMVGNPVPRVSVNTEVWIDQASYRVLRLRMQGPLVEGDVEGIARVIELSKFDEPVKIEPPT